MDPNATLAELRMAMTELADAASGRRHLEPGRPSLYDEIERANELWEALDGWILRGGFLPEEWEEALVRQSPETEEGTEQ